MKRLICFLMLMATAHADTTVAVIVSPTPEVAAAPAIDVFARMEAARAQQDEPDRDDEHADLRAAIKDLEAKIAGKSAGTRVAEAPGPSAAAYTPEVVVLSPPQHVMRSCPHCVRQINDLRAHPGLPFSVREATSESGPWPEIRFTTPTGQWMHLKERGYKSPETIIATWRQYHPAEQAAASGLPPEAQPTPWPAVGQALNLLKPSASEKFYDIGCGYDARVCIEASKYYGCTDVTGIEIDAGRADTARAHVADVGFDRWVKIINDDAANVDINGGVGFAYLYPETLRQLKSQLMRLDRFVTYQYQVPGLEMEKHGDFYLWKRRAPVQRQVARQVLTFDYLPQGSYCQQCGGYCSNPMSHNYWKRE